MDSNEKARSLSVVIPAFNEEALINESIVLLHQTLAKIAEDYEIIVVDDCSTDETLAVLNGLAGTIPELKVIHSDTNQGLGSTLRRGFSEASKALVFYTDADMPIDYSEIYRAVKVLGESRADFVIGFRSNRGSEPLYRGIYSFVYNRLIRLLFGIKVRDINFSFKLIKRAPLKSLHLKSEGSFIDAEMIVKAAYHGYKIEEIGTTYFARVRGYSTLARPNVIVKILGEMVRTYPEIMQIKRKNAKILSR